ncbi:MAG: hypothetical protein V9F05_19035 [Chitinophagaceae bacterium]
MFAQPASTSSVFIAPLTASIIISSDEKAPTDGINISGKIVSPFKQMLSFSNKKTGIAFAS